MQPISFFDQLAIQPNYTHIKPMSSHIFLGTRSLAIYLHQQASSHRWQRFILEASSKATTVAGYCLSMSAAVVEATIALGLGMVGAGIHVLTGARSDNLQRYTIKVLAYSFDSFTNFVLQASLLTRLQFPEYHFLTTILNQGRHILTAAFTQLSFGFIFDHISGRHSQVQQNLENRPIPPSVSRTGYLLAQLIPPALNEILRSLDRDFNHHRQEIQQPVIIQNFLAAHPEHAEFIRNFTFINLMQPTYRQSINRIIADFSIQQNLIRPSATDNTEFVVSNHQINDNAYREQLQGYVKNAVKEIYQTPALVSLIGENELEGKDASQVAIDSLQEGKDALEGFYPSVYLPLAHYTQLKEIESNLICPTQFGSSELQRYNERRQKLQSAQIELHMLSEGDKAILIKKLLKGSSFEVSVQGNSPEADRKIQKLFVEISELAGDLHQGKLMCQLTVNMNELNNLFSSQNLFQKAYQEAIQELQV